MHLRRILAALTAILLLVAPALAHTREEVRASYQAISDWTSGDLFAVFPSAVAPTPPARCVQKPWRTRLITSTSCAILPVWTRYRSIRRSPASPSRARCSPPPTALSATTPAAPEGMDAAFYDAAHYAASSCNIARLNWTSEDVLRQGVLYFARDDGAENLSTLGHRRWLLSPNMAYTGFGLATDDAGMSYITMYAHDLQADPGDWQYIAWPSKGAFPAELMSEDIAWSIILNPDLYGLDGAWARLTDLTTGEVYEFPGEGGYFAVDAGAYGAGPCIIFRPELTKDYEQNQRWRVEAGTASGAAISYEVEMISLYPWSRPRWKSPPARRSCAPERRSSSPPPSSPGGRTTFSIIWSSGGRDGRHRGKRPRHRRGRGRMRYIRHVRQRKIRRLPPDRRRITQRDGLGRGRVPAPSAFPKAGMAPGSPSWMGALSCRPRKGGREREPGHVDRDRRGDGHRRDHHVYHVQTPAIARFYSAKRRTRASVVFYVLFHMPSRSSRSAISR